MVPSFGVPTVQGSSTRPCEGSRSSETRGHGFSIEGPVGGHKHIPVKKGDPSKGGEPEPVEPLTLEYLLPHKPVLHEAEGKVDQSIDQRRWKFRLKAPHDGSEGVKLLPSPFPPLPQLPAAHSHGLEVGSAFPLILLQPPSLIYQPSLGLHPVIEFRARIGSQYGEHRGEDLCLDGKFHRTLEDSGVVVIKPKDEGGPDGDAIPVEGIYNLPVVGGPILELANGGDIFLNNGFKADEQSDTAALGHQTNGLLVT